MEAVLIRSRARPNASRDVLIPDRACPNVKGAALIPARERPNVKRAALIANRERPDSKQATGIGSEGIPECSKEILKRDSVMKFIMNAEASKEGEFISPKQARKEAVDMLQENRMGTNVKCIFQKTKHLCGNILSPENTI